MESVRHEKSGRASVAQEVMPSELQQRDAHLHTSSAPTWPLPL
jgi:hypothetical protein